MHPHPFPSQVFVDGEHLIYVIYIVPTLTIHCHYRSWGQDVIVCSLGGYGTSRVYTEQIGARVRHCALGHWDITASLSQRWPDLGLVLAVRIITQIAIVCFTYAHCDANEPCIIYEPSYRALFVAVGARGWEDVAYEIQFGTLLFVSR